MKKRFVTGGGVFLVVCLMILTGVPLYAGLPLEAPFTYQGQLKQNGVPVTDTCDFEFTLWNDSVGALAVNQVGPTLTFDGVVAIGVVNGLFTAELDFGVTAFNDDPRWLEVSVSCPTGVGVYTTLSPRERVTATPMSIHTRGITVDNVGNVGIGTPIPHSQLEVAGHVMIAAEGFDPHIDLYSDGLRDSTHMRIKSLNTVGFAIANGDDDSKMVVTSAGNVGIGTTAPAALLQVEGSVPDRLVHFNGRTARTLVEVEGVADTVLRVAGDASSLLFVQGSGSLFGNHIALFDSRSGPSSDGIAIRLQNDHTNRDNNFITFLNGQSLVTGRIEGFDLENGDWISPPPVLTASLSFDPGISYNEDWYTPGTLPTANFGPGSLPTANFNKGSLPTATFGRGALPSLTFNGGALPSATFGQGSLPSLTFSRGSLPSLSGQYCNVVGINVLCGFNWSAGSTPSASLNGGTLPSLSFNRGSLPTATFSQGSLPSLTFSGGSLPSLTFSGGALPSLSFNGGSLPTINKAPFILDEPTINLQLPSLQEVQDLFCWSQENGTSAFMTFDPISRAIVDLKMQVAGICKDEGVTYGSKGADYAEWLPKMDPKDRFQFGQIVGVHDGKVSLKTEGAQQIMAISRAPVVVGNVPLEAEKDNYVTVGFMGQLPVVVRGKVRPGDYIIPSGLEDGTAMAVSPTSLKLEHLNRILGRAWSESENDIYSLINVVIGLNGHETKIILDRHQYQLDEQNHQIMVLTQENDRLKKQMAAMNTQLAGMAESMRKIENFVSTKSLQNAKVVSATVQP